MEKKAKSEIYSAKIVERSHLSSPGSEKITQHIVLSLAEPISFQVGDSIAIYPTNDPLLVERILTCLELKESHRLKKALLTEKSISDPNRKLLEAIETKERNPELKKKLETLLAPEERDALKDFCEERWVWDLLEEHPNVRFSEDELISLLPPLLPRFYSIASSPKSHPKEIHLTVEMIEFTSNQKKRFGICSHYLCNLAETSRTEVPFYVQPSKGFSPPENLQTSIIMVGPGTGIAPFRGFMQERVATGASGKNWLFFGERHRDSHFYYEEFWKTLEKEGRLHLDTAFSRDQKTKIYVQHRMQEKGKELISWLFSGAHLYVCGDAKRMAKDVETTLLSILQSEGSLDEKGAFAYLRQMRKEKRYVRDVY